MRHRLCRRADGAVVGLTYTHISHTSKLSYETQSRGIVREPPVGWLTALACPSSHAMRACALFQGCTTVVRVCDLFAVIPNKQS
jgi:hypothetical protein